ncbi:hypothetical protein AR457_38025 [Streptomyces agglomeratus]|uniref:hypothetical protein n=1 Tax=Streptomyces agglomeratus TaxID=285458 RepID=UPI0008525B8E|nr:hypothetical protein [Streptomyces agglomeratus]OEJ23002.1 hypothetical protein AR457_38025 [Streptomyces agglomeratus]OEJ36861.1 hypothetical protein BGK70_00330 [Streptomyces agglomeratus]
MAADEPGPRRPRGDNVQNAIEWFTTDHSRTRQTIEHPAGPIAPGQLLDSARFDVQVNQLLDRQAAEQAQALIHAQAEWLIRRMPSEHNHLSLDSAQQAGRAWGILITADTEALPDQDVLTEVAARTGISGRAADEIRSQARSTSAAYNRADLLIPYDDAKEEVLIGDWNRLAACGPELPEAAERAQDVLELLTARVTGADDHDWMDAAAQHAAQVYASVIHAQPLLASVAAVIPTREQPDASADQARLVELDQQGHLTTAATAAARARAVQEWADLRSAAEPDRTRTVEAAAPGTRTLLQLNETLAALDPVHGQSAFTALDPQRVAQVVEAIGQLSARMSNVLRTASTLPAARGEQYTQQRQHPPTPGQSPGGSTPRATP